ncbi:Thermoresistant gluconokinase [Hartmannibacter diazotrophicus]|uniref:Gluconokinase n=1 Tax=Hartmannibacter diazotrophicus TaxID=1482074 RepID=A0A2C9D2K4_9HYPH|nr:gluconokinase [Hartmannibacter diazotrophicus]SON54494.1 Thermoresistant gluconokinase [Hartmannibacter diazotrophicus]
MRRAIVVMGVSGSGKSTVGAALAARLGLAYVDGDDLHSEACVAKMRRGEALTDDDRWPWLDRVAAVLDDRQRNPAGVIVGCSALRRRYRDRIRAAVESDIRFLFLDGSFDLLNERMAARKGHYMPVSLLKSQFAALEVPGADEPDVMAIDVAKPVETIVGEAARLVGRQDH